jgi:hypothetical protein
MKSLLVAVLALAFLAQSQPDPARAQEPVPGLENGVIRNHKPDPDWVVPRPLKNADGLLKDAERAGTRLIDHVAAKASQIVYADGVWRGVIMTLVAELAAAVVVLFIWALRRPNA